MFSVINTWLHSSHGPLLSTLSYYSEGNSGYTCIQKVKKLLPRQRSAVYSIARLPKHNLLHTFRTLTVKLSASRHSPGLGLHASFLDIQNTVFVSILLWHFLVARQSRWSVRDLVYTTVSCHVVLCQLARDTTLLIGHAVNWKLLHLSTPTIFTAGGLDEKHQCYI